jgi:hypothetical protein
MTGIKRPSALIKIYSKVLPIYLNTCKPSLRSKHSREEEFHDKSVY